MGLIQHAIDLPGNVRCRIHDHDDEALVPRPDVLYLHNSRYVVIQGFTGGGQGFCYPGVVVGANENRFLELPEALPLDTHGDLVGDPEGPLIPQRENVGGEYGKGRILDCVPDFLRAYDDDGMGVSVGQRLVTA